MTSCPHTLTPDGLPCTLPQGHEFGHVYQATHGADLSGEVGGDE